MPTTPDAGSGAAAASRREAEVWTAVASEVVGLDDLKVEPTEAAVVGFHDPGADLERRARRWGHSLDSHHLASLARFAAGLALAESEAWEDDRRDVAMRAFTDRRHLIADRIVHWAVPLLAAAARHRGTEPDALGAITSIANEMRVAPGHVRGEGVHPPGEDGFGPLPGDDLDTAFLRSLWSGAVLVGKNRAAAADHAAGPLLRPVYEWWSVRWSDLADSEPATAALWIDLSMRAAHSARILGFCGKA